MNDFQTSFQFHPVERRYRVSDLNREIANLLTVEFSDIWVEGEISDPRISRQGHIYFTLKDQDSVLNCVCFRNVSRLLRFRLEEGLAVSARGRVDVYEVRGQYQFIVEAVELRGQGALQMAFEALKRKLEEEGLFRAERKRPLPSMPQRIGIVTSPTGAAIQDILSILERRFPGLHIRIYPTLVQGEAAPGQIAAGLRHFSENPWADVVIVGRGGGSLEDLWAFNTEVVARAIAGSRVPVIAAVGHETDFTIADFVADLRAPTPSAAAELAVPRKDDLLQSLRSRWEQMDRAYRLMLSGKARHLQAAGTERAYAMLQRRLRTAAQRLDEAEFRTRQVMTSYFRRTSQELSGMQHRLLQFDLRLQLLRLRERLQSQEARMDGASRARMQVRRGRVETLTARLQSLSPLAILNRGYALARREDGSLVRDAAELKVGETLQLRFAQGIAAARVDSTEEGTAG